MSLALRSVLAVIVSLVVALSVALGWLVGTTSGGQWLAAVVDEREPRLSLEVDSGSLWAGLGIRRLEWRDEQVEVVIAELQARWEPVCLLQRRLCLEALQVEQPRVTLRSDPAAAPREPAAPAEPLDLPLDIRLDGARLRDLELRLDDTSVRLGELRLAGLLSGDRLRLDYVHLRELAVELPAAGAAEPAAAKPAPDPGETAPLQLPLAVELGELRLDGARLRQGEELTLALGELRLAGRLDSERLHLESVTARELALRLPAPEPGPEPAAATAAERAPIELPAVDLPLAVVVDALRLEQAELQRGDDVQRLQRLELAGELAERRLQLAELSVVHEEFRAAAEGAVELAGDYPLSVDLRLEAPRLLDEGPLRLAVELRDSVAELAVRARLEGIAELVLEGRLQPLQPTLPFSVDVDWHALGWPLDSHELVRARAGHLQAFGNLERYHLMLEADVGGPDLPPGRWALQGQGDAESLLIEQLLAEVLDGRLQGSGRLSWADGVDWDAHLEAAGIDPGAYLEDYPGRISGSVISTGAVGEAGWRLSVETDDLAGELQGYPFALQARVAKDFDDRWRFDRLRLASGDNRIEVSGTLTEQWDLAGRLWLPQPELLLPELTGEARAEFELAGPLATPDIDLRLVGQDLRYDEVSLAAVDIEGRIAALGEADSELRWRLQGLIADQQRLDELTGELSGRLAEHSLRLQAAGSVAEQPLEAEVELSGGLDEQLWEGALSAARLAFARQDWRLQAPTALQWRGDEALLRVAGHCWGYREASLCLQEDAAVGAAGGELTLALRDFQFDWLAPLLPPGVFWHGPLTLDARLAWAEEAAPVLDLQAASRAGGLLLSEEAAPALELDYRELGLRAQVDAEGLRAELRLDSDNLGDVRLDLRAIPEGEQYRLAGDVSLTALRLAPIRAFFPELTTLRGEINAQGELGGTLDAPLFFGEVSLEDAALASPELPMELSALGLRARIDGTRAELDGRFRSGPGEGRLTGSADWSAMDQWRLDLNITGEQLQAIYQPVANVRLNPDLRLVMRPGELRVGGRIDIPRGEITLQELPEQAVAVSDDVVIVRRHEAVEPPPEERELPWLVVADIQVVFGRNVTVSGYGVSGRLAGALRLRQEAEATPEAFGEIRLEDGRYEAYGQRLEIRRGRLIFAGPVAEPSLDIEAVRVVNDVTAGLRITGQPEQPQAELFSEPGMPQEDILSYIIRGRPAADAGPGGSAMLTGAALALGALGGQELTAGVAEQLGVEDFALDIAGEGEEAQFMVSGYLAPNLFLRYGVGVFEPGQQLTIRYHLHPRLYVEAMRGVENALDFFYTFEF